MTSAICCGSAVASHSATLSPRDGDRVLEIGTGSGYQTAILARLSAQVVSIERHAALAAQAQVRLDAAGITNVQIVVGDGSTGAPRPAQFDRILVTAGAPSVPESLRSQLADGGRLVIPVGPPDMQRLVIVDRHGGEFNVREGEACVFVPLIGREGWEGT